MALPTEIKGCPLFTEMYEREIEKVVKRGLVATYKPGDFVVKEGEEGDEIFVILDGELWAQKTIPQGVVKIAPLVKGDVFGELVLLDDKIRSADIVSQTPSNVLEISYKQIFELYKTEPRVFGLLLLNLSRLLARRLRTTNALMLDLQKEIQREII